MDGTTGRINWVWRRQVNRRPVIRQRWRRPEELPRPGTGPIIVAAELRLPDFFTSIVGEAMATLDRAPEGGARFPVDARLDGRTFVTFHVDLGLGDEAGEVTRRRMRLQAPWLPTSQAVQILPRTWQGPLRFTERPLCGCGGTQRTLVSLVERGGVRSAYASSRAARVMT